MRIHISIFSENYPNTVEPVAVEYNIQFLFADKQSNAHKKSKTRGYSQSPIQRCNKILEFFDFFSIDFYFGLDII